MNWGTVPDICKLKFLALKKNSKFFDFEKDCTLTFLKKFEKKIP